MRRVEVTLVALLLVVLTGCSAVPDSSSPRAIGTVDRAPASSTVPRPTSGMEPDLLVREFLKASANPSARHQGARQFLTASAARSWDDLASSTVVDQIDTFGEDRTADSISISLRVNKIGTLDSQGVFDTTDGALTARLRVVKTADGWRIDDLPPGVLIDKTQFVATYSPRMLYFVDPTGTAIVPDPRWIFSDSNQLVSELVARLMSGPRPRFDQSVRNELGNGVSLRGPITKADGRAADVGVGLGGVSIDFQGITTMDTADRQLLAAQVIWTLATAEISGPYNLMADGSPLDPRMTNGWTTADVAATNPKADPGADAGITAIRGGTLVSVGDTGATPVGGAFGTLTTLRSVGMSADGRQLAGVIDEPRPEAPQSLLVGPRGQMATRVAVGRTITRPTWGLDSSVWAVVDGTNVIRAVREAATGQASQVAVDVSAVTSYADGPITELRLSRDGVRAAMIIKGRVITALVQRSGGGFALTNPRLVAQQISMATSLSWTGGDALVIAQSVDDNPVVQVRLDGLGVEPLPNRNLSPPVGIITASPTMLLVADRRGVLRLGNAGDAESRYWTEVPPLMDGKSIPVLPG